MQVGQQIVELLIGQCIAHRRHHASSPDNHRSDTGVIRDSSTRQIRFAKEPLKTRARETFFAVGVVAAGA